MIPQDPIKTATLADAEKYVYKAECSRCHHNQEIDLAALRISLGPDFKIDNIRERLRCSECGQTDSIVSFYLKDWSFAK